MFINPNLVYLLAGSVFSIFRLRKEVRRLQNQSARLRAISEAQVEYIAYLMEKLESGGIEWNEFDRIVTENFLNDLRKVVDA